MNYPVLTLCAISAVGVVLGVAALITGHVWAALGIILIAGLLSWWFITAWIGRQTK
jgi:hypothetical protein